MAFAELTLIRNSPSFDPFASHDAAKVELFGCIEVFHDPKRLHSRLGHVSLPAFDQRPEVAR